MKAFKVAKEPHFQWFYKSGLVLFILIMALTLYSFWHRRPSRLEEYSLMPVGWSWMMGWLTWLSLLVQAIALPMNNPPNRTVILISMDGFRPDYLNLGLTPTLERLGQYGVRANHMKPAFPSITFPNHFTLVTGLYPEQHGIIGNVMWDPKDNTTFIYHDPKLNSDAKWWQAEPIWITAEKQGIKTGVCMWPGSEVYYNHTRPTYLIPYQNMAIQDKVDQLLEWMDLESSPGFMTMYIPEVDSAGHASGPFSDNVLSALRMVEKGMHRLWQGLESRDLLDKVDMVVVSDHGMTDVSLDRIIYLQDIMNVTQVKIVDNNPILLLFPLDVKDTTKVYKSLEQATKTVGHYHVYYKEEMPQEYQYRQHERIAPIVLVADSGWVFVPQREHFDTKYMPKGMHGYNNSLPEMHALFLAHGPHIRSSLVPIPEFDNVQVYDILCRLLTIHPNPNHSQGTLYPLVLL